MDRRWPDGPRRARDHRAGWPRAATGADGQPANLRLPVRVGRGAGALFRAWEMRTYIDNRRSEVTGDWPALTTALSPRIERPELCARLAPLNQPTAPSPRPSPPPRGRGCPKGGRGGGHGQGTAAARRVFWAHWIGKLRRGHSPNPAEDSPSVQGRVARLAIAHRPTLASPSQKSR